MLEVTMYDVRKELKDLVDQAKALHANVRHLALDSVILIESLDRRNASNNLLMTTHQFAKFIGLTPSLYWKRVQAARVIRIFPIALDMVKAGELHISHLVLLSSKITQANADTLFAGIKNKSKREVEKFIARVTNDGKILPSEPPTDFVLKLTGKEQKLLDQAREFLSFNGHTPSQSEVIVCALNCLLENREQKNDEFRILCASPGKQIGCHRGMQ